MPRRACQDGPMACDMHAEPETCDVHAETRNHAELMGMWSNHAELMGMWRRACQDGWHAMCMPSPTRACRDEHAGRRACDAPLNVGHHTSEV
jgi:hypothetical protein